MEGTNTGQVERDTGWELAKVHYFIGEKGQFFQGAGNEELLVPLFHRFFLFQSCKKGNEKLPCCMK